MKEGWEVKKLKDVAEYFNGLTYSPKDVSNKGIVVLRSSNIQNDELDFNDIVRVNLEVKERLKVKDGDVIMCSRNGSARLVGKTATVKNLSEVMTFGTFMMIIRSPYNPYLAWFFKSEGFRNQIKGGENTMINQITRYMLDEIFLPLPSLLEQQRIVSIIDKAFEAIDKAIENTQKNLQNAKELFESYLNNVFENGGEGWMECKVKEIGFAQTGTTPKTAMDENYGNFIPFVKPADIDYSGIGDIRYNNEGLSEIGLKHGRKMLSGSILMVCIGATIGKVGFAVIDVSCNQQINSLTVDKVYEPKFIYYAMRSKQFQEKILSEGKGAQATLPIINKSKWENLNMVIPKSKATQQSIVRILDDLLSEIKNLEANYQQKLRDLEELKKSILNKAFAGEL